MKLIITINIPANAEKDIETIKEEMDNLLEYSNLFEDLNYPSWEQKEVV